ncbi:putative ribonuclease H-like domain-containing protein [Tanacetum coccineum]
MDVKSVFLYGTIEEEVYVSQPPCFVDPKFPEKFYKVEKALYGLHQAPRAWYETLSTYLLDNGFYREEDGIFISQDKYVGEILKKFDFSCIRTAITPMETNKALTKDEDARMVDTKIHVDNESAICVVKNPVYHSKTKHIEIQHHFIRDSYEKRLIKMVKIHTDNNVADLLTKAFAGMDTGGSPRRQDTMGVLLLRLEREGCSSCRDPQTNEKKQGFNKDKGSQAPNNLRRRKTTVHTLFMDGTPMEINMLVEKKYPLIKELLEKMLNLQLEAKEESTMAFELIKFIKSMLEE